MPRTLAPGVAERSAGLPYGSQLRRCSDDRLVAAAREGHEQAYDEILRRYRSPLQSYCTQLLGPSRAEDAVQQALLQALIALRSGQSRSIALRPWLYRIAHNCAIDLLRKNGWNYEELDLEYDGVAQPPQLVEQKERLGELVASLLTLPYKQRRALTLRELEGRSYGEIAHELGRTTASVRQLIFRARTTARSLPQ
jgi:RNA polymerase sigma factor (sigma-70 family)